MYDIKELLLAAKVGGWIGLVVGASLISFLEFIYFAILLLRKVCCSTNNNVDQTKDIVE